MIQPFDWQRMFLGDNSWLFLLEIVFRTTFLYLYAIVLLRLTGSRGVGQLSAFDIVIIIAMGSAVGDPMFYPNVPLLHGLVVITVIVLIQRLISLVLTKRKKIEGFLEGKPITLLKDGKLLLENMNRATLSQEDIFMNLRHQGIDHLGKVRRVYFEHDGQFSVFTYPRDEILAGLPIVPPRDILEPEATLAGSKPKQSGLYACLQCGETDYAGHVSPLPICPRCGNDEWILAKGTTPY